MGVITAILRYADRLIAPPLCPGCGKVLDDGRRDAELCGDCAAELPELPEKRCGSCGGFNDSMLSVCRDCWDNPRPWFRGVSALPYHGPAGEMIRACKFGRRTEFAPVFARKMAAAWRQYGAPAQPEAIVPVPLHWFRRCRRGFNQTALIGEFLAKELGLPMYQWLRRARPTPHQARLDAAQRMHNMRGAFRASPAVNGRALLLIDDVFTTGATLTCAAEALLNAGAAEVSVLTIARA